MRKQARQVHQCLCGFAVAVTIVIVTNPYLIFDMEQSGRPSAGLTFNSTVVSKKTFFCSTCKNNRGPKRLVSDVDCLRIIEGDEKYIQSVKNVMDNKIFAFKSDAEMADVSENCETFLSKYDYGNFNVTKEELEFPIAYSILTYKEAMQTEQLLRSIYRPHNVYCIHIDKKAPPSLHRAIKNIGNCLQNVFIASKLEEVIYAGFSRLQADLNCMSDLLNYLHVSWKYLINIPHQQYPLKTNAEIVKILKIYNGANDIEGITTPGRMYRSRYLSSFKLENKNMVNTGKKKDPPPLGIKVVKGSAYGVFSRDFVNFALHDKMAKVVLKWCEDVKSPDEYFWAILNFNKVVNAPGGYFDKPDNKPWLAVYAAWGGVNSCHGKFIRGVCVFGIGDLTELVSKRELFVNKFYYNYQPYALQCLEEWHRNKSFSNLPFETHFYKTLPFIIKTS
ncbi:N-acetyllactosaminide beta-1,6-N-acetylglucosaminyl-transferase-like [Saccostrea cucullata]|uniref:N-acetyllactosaminide beta-1,6-N-acetylglucosaminyl-transferase-like n=1 Tax=Saccostrea cuccullata TaxID=36930 RepID=UPI002ED6AF04